MKYFLSVAFCFFYVYSVYGQSDVTVLNGYKFVYLAPLQYQDGSLDVWGIRNQVKSKLVNSGIKILESTTPPVGVDVCLVVSCYIEHTNYAYQSTSDYVTLRFINCLSQEVYTSKGSTGVFVTSFQQGWRRATISATRDFTYYKHTFNESKSFFKSHQKSLPTLEVISISEDSIKKYLSNNKIDAIEGIYKTYQNEKMPYYKLGIIKVNGIYKALVIDGDFNYWKKGELKATFENSSMKGLYSTKWYMSNKTSYETFAFFENEALLSIEFQDENSNEKRYDKLIKLYPNTANGSGISKDNSIVSGSGFFMSRDGIIATNAHVVENAKNIEVTISNDYSVNTYKAKLVLIDTKNDIALLSIEDEKFKGLNKIPFGIVENADVGTKVFTIGYPLNNFMGNN